MNVACYVRVSTEEQKKYGISLDAQRSRLTAFCKENKYKSTFYADEGISARKAANKRPALMQLLDDVSAGKIDLILFTKLDRWTRNVREYHKCQEVLEAKNVPWKAVDEDYETQTASGRFKVNIMLAVAEDEADRTSERIKAVFESQRAKNIPTSAKVPRGYIYTRHKVSVDENLREDVKGAFQTYLDTGSLKAVCKKYPALHLDYQSANRMLRMRAYTGDWVVQIEPIITTELFEAVQNAFPKYSRQTIHNHVYLFSGILFCGECGWRLAGRTKEFKYNNYIAYYCPTYDKMSGCGQKRMVREKVIEQYLLDNIEYKAQATVVAKEKEEVKQDMTPAIKKKLSRLSELYVNDLISIDDYKKQYNELTEELSRCSAPQKQKAKDYTDFFFADWKAVYNELSRENKKAFWRSIIDKIILTDGKVTDFTLL